MRRACLLALAVGPSIALGQVPATGTITFDDLRWESTDRYINVDECSGGTIELDWTIELTTTAPLGTVTHTLYAANKATTGDCPVENGDKNDNALRAGPVGSVSDNDMSVIDIDFATSVIVEAAGKTCSGTAEEDIHLCMQASSGGNIGVARGTLTLSLSLPNAPESLSASPGENALNLSWPEVNTGPTVEYYEVTATSCIDPENPTSLDPRDTRVHSQKFDTPRDARLTGLTNDVQYCAEISSFTTADNRSTTSAKAFARSENVLDFGEWYHARGGREQGGCAGGPAGLASLAVAAAVLAALRRRK